MKSFTRIVLITLMTIMSAFNCADAQVPTDSIVADFNESSDYSKRPISNFCFVSGLGFNLLNFAIGCIT